MLNFQDLRLNCEKCIFIFHNHEPTQIFAPAQNMKKEKAYAINLLENLSRALFIVGG